MKSLGGYTAAQGRKNRMRLLKDIEEMELRRHKEKIAKLREEAAKHRGARDRRLCEAKKSCAAHRQAVREAADEAYKKAVTKAREERRAKKRAATEACARDREAIRAEENPRIASVREKQTQERQFWNEIHRSTKAGQKRKRPRSSAAERRAESDHEVVVNIPENLIPLWETVRRQIKGSARISRTEEFLRYVEEHPGEVFAAQEREVERHLQAEQRRLAKEAEVVGTGPRKARKRQTKAIDNYRDLVDFFDSVALTG